MGQALDQARRQRELSKDALQADLQRLEARVRSELDIRTRLRRDGPRVLAIAGAAVVLVGTIVLVRARLGHKRAEDAGPATLDDLVAELRELRGSIEKQKSKESSGLPQKLLLRAVSGAAAAGGTYAVRRVLERQTAEQEERGTRRAG